MVWIYGGAFMFGSSTGIEILKFVQYSGQELADRGNVIVVSIGYRVGSLGFLSTGEPELAGNYGGASVNLQILSPHNKGLFKRAIAQSGVAVCPWTIKNNSREYAVEVALKVNCPTDERMASCLKEIDPVDLILAGSFNFSRNSSDPIAYHLGIIRSHFLLPGIISCHRR
ncbi:hypothetical protein CesoFtcFv8_023860 [Champsocephalus esox]|uniref:Carboxylesterase type B domain-containing protein n=1 Tax=Champsocephalus esox TaxID=159716 RepID=A0AAN8B5U7_9TELE|nr:hypothetical protein CesoFtcFv8_023860 [Champsocephalus esox]